jgi:hypothetical protein
MPCALRPRLRVLPPALALAAHGLVWWLAGPPTGPLAAAPPPGRPWALLMASLEALGLPPGASGIWIGGLAGAVILAVVFDLAGRVEGPGVRTGGLAPALLVVSPLCARAVIGAPEVAAFTALLAVAVRRTFDETGTAGLRSVSILPWALIAAWCPPGMILLVAVFVHRLLYARRYALGRPAVAVFGVWLLLALAGAGLLLALLGGWSGGPFAPPRLAPAGAWRLLLALWHGLQAPLLVPFLALLALSWKPRPIWYLASLTLVLVPLWLVVAGAPAAPAAAVSLLPILPLVALVTGEALREGVTVLEAGGLRGTPAHAVLAVYLLVLGVSTLWPTVELTSRVVP